LTWLIPFRRLSLTSHGSAKQFLARLDDTAFVERRDGSFVASSREGLGRNAYRPHAHLRVAEREGTLVIVGWIAPSMIGVAGLLGLGLFTWSRHIATLGEAAVGVLAVHIVFSTFGYVPESVRLERHLATAVHEAPPAGPMHE
jgi:hypothetical protein